MKNERAAWVFVAPATLHLVVFALGPILVAFGLTFCHWNLLKGGVSFVGFQNYAEIWVGGGFGKALFNSFVYAAASVPLGTALALGVALLVSQKVRGAALFRTLYYLPSVCSQVAIAMIWTYIYLPKKGMVDAVLGMAHLPDGTDFLATQGWAMAALVFMGLWVGLGPRMILYVSGILNIPESLYEASRLDGANGSQQFWRVTLPLLAPTTLFVVVTSTIGALQVFTPVYMMTQGGPEGSTDVVGYHIYSAAWERFQIGEASAMSFVLFLVVLAVSAVQFRSMRGHSEGYA